MPCWKKRQAFCTTKKRIHSTYHAVSVVSKADYSHFCHCKHTIVMENAGKDYSKLKRKMFNTQIIHMTMIVALPSCTAHGSQVETKTSQLFGLKI